MKDATSGGCILMDWSRVPKPRFDPASKFFADGATYTPGMPVWDDEGRRLPDQVTLQWDAHWGWSHDFDETDIGGFICHGPYFSSEASYLESKIASLEQDLAMEQRIVRRIEDRLSDLRERLTKAKGMGVG